MMKRINAYIKDIFTDPFGVGQTVFWDNPVDYRFRECYTITKKEDNRGLVGIYNKTKGERFAHRHELVPVNEMTESTKEKIKHK